MKKLPYPRQVAMEALFTGHGPTTFKGKEHNLSRSYLVELFLENAEMPDVRLDRSNLQKAQLAGSNLVNASLVRSDLRGADLSGADLRGADLSRADLRGANLAGANLRGADITLAKLQGASLYMTNLDGSEQLATVASLYEAKGLISEIVSELMDFHPGLFTEPKIPSDDLDYFTTK